MNRVEDLLESLFQLEEAVDALLSEETPQPLGNSVSLTPTVANNP
jgi:hypothetical protein